MDQEPEITSGFSERAARRVATKLLDAGIDGLGPLESVDEMIRGLGTKAADPERAVAVLRRRHIRWAATGGFATGVGGAFTLPVALPANVMGFYVLATRLVAGTATLRGYDVTRPEVRSAVLLTLVGADSSDVLKKAGLPVPGKVSQIAVDRLPDAAIMVINKGVGFRVATQVGSRFFGRSVPLVGGLVGGGLDGFLMGTIGDHAKEQFPARHRLGEAASAEAIAGSADAGIHNG